MSGLHLFECVKNCTFLRHYVQGFPAAEQELVQILEDRGEAEPDMPYFCHICGLCQAVCPQGLDLGQACLEVRERLVAQGKAPLPSLPPVRVWGR